MKATLKILVAISKAMRMLYEFAELSKLMAKKSQDTPKRDWPATDMASIKNAKC